MFVQFKSAAILAINSVSKKEERLIMLLLIMMILSDPILILNLWNRRTRLEMISRKKLLHLHPIKNTICRLKILMHQIQR